MISSLYRFAQSERRELARVWGLRSVAARAERRQARGPDAARYALPLAAAFLTPF